MRDNFEIGSFANNDGTHRWYGDWVEQNDNNSPYGGKVTIGWLDTGGKRRMICGGNGAIYRRAATPSNSPQRHAQVQVARAAASKSGEYVSVQASANGGVAVDRGRPHFGRRQRHAASPPELQHHGVPRPQHRDPLRRVDERVVPRRLRRSSTTSRSPTPRTYGEGDPAARRRERAGPARRRHPRPRHRRRHHRHRLLEARLARQGFGAATAAWRCSTTPCQQRGQTTWSSVSTDTNGHGTHITSLIASSRKNGTGRYFGVAPDARIISIKAFGEDGSSSYATVIRAIDWVITNRTAVRHPRSEFVARGPGAFALLGRSAQ